MIFSQKAFRNILGVFCGIFLFFSSDIFALSTDPLRARLININKSISVYDNLINNNNFYTKEEIKRREDYIKSRQDLYVKRSSIINDIQNKSKNNTELIQQQQSTNTSNTTNAQQQTKSITSVNENVAKKLNTEKENQQEQIIELRTRIQENQPKSTDTLEQKKEKEGTIKHANILIKSLKDSQKKTKDQIELNQEEEKEKEIKKKLAAQEVLKEAKNSEYSPQEHNNLKRSKAENKQKIKLLEKKIRQDEQQKLEIETTQKDKLNDDVTTAQSKLNQQNDVIRVLEEAQPKTTSNAAALKKAKERQTQLTSELNTAKTAKEKDLTENKENHGEPAQGWKKERTLLDKEIEKQQKDPKMIAANKKVKDAETVSKKASDKLRKAKTPQEKSDANAELTKANDALKTAEIEKEVVEKDLRITELKKRRANANRNMIKALNKKAASDIEKMVQETSYFSITGKTRNIAGVITTNKDSKFRRLAVGNEDKLELIGTGEIPINDRKSILNKIINIIATTVGTLAVLLYVIAGFFFITSQTDQQVEKAKSIIINTSIGLIIVFTAYILVQLVINFIFRV